MALKVFDLQCDQGHLFEGWFSSHDDYDSQQARGLLTCPMCNSATIIKKLSAPRLNVSHLRAPAAPEKDLRESAPVSKTPASDVSSPSAPPDLADPATVARLQAAVLQQMRNVIRKTENVGPRFAEEARRIHEGDADDRPIRGTATPDERAALTEEGISVISVPDFLDDDRLQ